MFVLQKPISFTNLISFSCCLVCIQHARFMHMLQVFSDFSVSLWQNYSATSMLHHFESFSVVLCARTIGSDLEYFLWGGKGVA